jgi:hypothetical protein
MHPPWHCKVFRRIQAKEREKIIEDNQLCQFCLLHDKAKPCGARERLANPACHVPGCKGKHIRKLHELLKDVFKEENQVHLVQGGGEWEESEAVWEVDGEEEAMIVGTIQREDNCSWQDASKSWLEQDEEEEDEIYHVGTCQGASSPPSETKEEQCSVIACPLQKEDEDAETIENSWWTPEPEDLQIKEGERDYFLELLMGSSAPSKGAAERPTTVGNKADQSAEKEATRGNKPALSKGKRKGSVKNPKGGSGVSAKPEKKEASAQNERRPAGSQSSNQGQAVPPDLPGDPEPESGGPRTQAQPGACDHERK